MPVPTRPARVAAVAQMHGDRAIRMARLNQHRRAQLAALVLQLHHVAESADACQPGAPSPDS